MPTEGAADSAPLHDSSVIEEAAAESDLNAAAKRDKDASMEVEEQIIDDDNDEKGESGAVMSQEDFVEEAVDESTVQEGGSIILSQPQFDSVQGTPVKNVAGLVATGSQDIIDADDDVDDD